MAWYKVDLNYMPVSNVGVIVTAEIVTQDLKDSFA